MHHAKQAAAVVVVALIASLGAFAQGTDSSQRGRRAVTEAATEALSLSEEQLEQIQEIRRERPPRGQDREAAESWAEEQRSKIRAVLTDEQTAKVAELEAARQEMRAYSAIALLGLTDSPGRSFGMMPDRQARSRGSREFGRDRDGRNSARGRRGSQSRGRPGGRSWRGRGPDRGRGSARR